MALSHPRSATNSRSRPIGPRSPKPLPTNDLPWDATNRPEESYPAYSPLNSSSSNTRAGTPDEGHRVSFFQDLVETQQSESATLPVTECSSPQRLLIETSIQTDPTNTLELPPPATSPRLPSPVVKKVPKPQTLAAPPALKFESEPVQWRGMTLEVAHWTFSSQELQEIVSAAIRKSAQESFIRLVPTKVFEEELSAELERLETLKLTTQGQYRFNMQMRTMLLQSLNALASIDGVDPDSLISVTARLAQVTVTCDRLMETLIHISDQRAQIQRIQDMHIASALAMVLRKLNSSYLKRVNELKEARARIEEMKAELKEAWDVAQEMALEMDDLDNFHTGFTDDEQETVAHPGDDAVRDVEMVGGVTGVAVATKVALTDIVDPVIAAGDYSNRVTAARKRSSRASKASLRRTKGANGDRVSIGSISRRKSQNRGAHQPPAEDEKVPDVPTLLVENVASVHEKSFLELSETRPVSPAAGVSFSETVPPLPAPPNISQHYGSQSEVPPAPNELIVTRPPPRISQLIPSPAFHSVFPHPPEGQSARNRNARRVQSLQVRGPRHPRDDLSIDPVNSLVQATQSDDWPSLATDPVKRYTVPLTNAVTESMAAQYPDRNMLRESLNMAASHSVNETDS